MKFHHRKNRFPVRGSTTTASDKAASFFVHSGYQMIGNGEGCGETISISTSKKIAGTSPLSASSRSYYLVTGWLVLAHLSLVVVKMTGCERALRSTSAK
jgi:hypothetical protein